MSSDGSLLADLFFNQKGFDTSSRQGNAGHHPTIQGGYLYRRSDVGGTDGESGGGGYYSAGGRSGGSSDSSTDGSGTTNSSFAIQAKEIQAVIDKVTTHLEEKVERLESSQSRNTDD